MFKRCIITSWLLSFQLWPIMKIINQLKRINSEIQNSRFQFNFRLHVDWIDSLTSSNKKTLPWILHLCVWLLWPFALKGEYLFVVFFRIFLLKIWLRFGRKFLFSHFVRRSEFFFTEIQFSSRDVNLIIDFKKVDIPKKRKCDDFRVFKKFSLRINLTMVSVQFIAFTHYQYRPNSKRT